MVTKFVVNILLETAANCRGYFAYLEKDISQRKYWLFSILMTLELDATHRLRMNYHA